MSDTARIVIVGAGHAGVQAAASLREEGYEGHITLVGDDRHLPYQRPALSKGFLKGEVDLDGLPLRGESFFRDHRIDAVFGAKAIRLDRVDRRLELSTGAALGYDRLILATGAQARELKVPGVDHTNVICLRSVDDAQAIRTELGNAKRVVVIGAGFIGLEVAATARKLGVEVTIVEIADRPMGRAVSPAVSAFFAEAHREFGAKLMFSTGIAGILGDGRRASAVETSTGERIACDLVILGVGVVAHDALAANAGLDIQNGVRVDSLMRTSDETIYAIGDCCNFPSSHLASSVRLESVQNATDQARCAARALVGKGAHYEALPWFWSDQGDLKLQIAGLSHGVDSWTTRGEPASRAFSVFGFKDGALRVVESVNRPADHMAARRLIGSSQAPSPDQAADTSFDLRKLAMSVKPR